VENCVIIHLNDATHEQDTQGSLLHCWPCADQDIARRHRWPVVKHSVVDVYAHITGSYRQWCGRWWWCCCCCYRL